MPQSTSDPTSGHPIFQGPLPIELELEEVPTPPKYKYYELTDDVPDTMTTVKILKKEWDTLNLPVGGRPDNGEPGVVTTGDGFLDSPDTEWIAGGTHLKGPDYFAIGRQGRLLQWGFYGTVDEMTETGQRLLINAVHYIHGFRDHPILATREARPREALATSLALLDNYATEEMKEYYDTPEKVKEAQDRVLEHSFGETVPPEASGSREERQAWYEENEPYLYWDGARIGSEYGGKAYFRLEGKYRIDEDARALGIANNDPALLERAVADLREGVEPERAERLLARYAGVSHDSADGWQGWLDENGASLFASDWAGYRFRAAQGPGGSDLLSSSRFAADGDELDDLSVTVSPAVEVTMRATTDGETTLAVLDFKLEPGFWIYAPGSDAEFKFGVRAPSGFAYQVASDPVLPEADGEGRIHGDFRVEVPLMGEGAVATVLVDYQACDETLCHYPVTDARLMSKVET